MARMMRGLSAVMLVSAACASESPRIAGGELAAPRARRARAVPGRRQRVESARDRVASLGEGESRGPAADGRGRRCLLGLQHARAARLPRARRVSAGRAPRRPPIHWRSTTRTSSTRSCRSARRRSRASSNVRASCR